MIGFKHCCTSNQMQSTWSNLVPTAFVVGTWSSLCDVITSRRPVRYAVVCFNGFVGIFHCEVLKIIGNILPWRRNSGRFKPRGDIRNRHRFSFASQLLLSLEIVGAGGGGLLLATEWLLASVVVWFITSIHCAFNLPVWWSITAEVVGLCWAAVTFRLFLPNCGLW